MGAAYRCAEHGAKMVANRRHLSGYAMFVRGRTDDFARTLDILWRIDEGESQGQESEDSQ